MSPRTVFAFPGLNGLSNPARLAPFLALDRVRHNLARAEATLFEEMGERVDLAGLFGRASDRAGVADVEQHLFLSAAALFAIQLGVAETLRQRLGAPDWVAGISLGDVSRAVFAGCASLEDAIRISVRAYREGGSLSSDGEIVAALLPRDQPCDAALQAQLEQMGLSCCFGSDRILTLGGSRDAIAAARRLAEDRGWFMASVAAMPFHTPLVSPIANAISGWLARFELLAPRLALFSTQCQRRLREADEVRDELSGSLTSTYDWRETSRNLLLGEGITRLVNIGPCGTFPRAARHSLVPVEVVDARALITAT